MPLYEYLCQSCGRTLEVIQSYSEPPLAVCDRCGGALTKLMSAPAVQFKGTGWYVSDYGKSGSSGKTTKKEGGEGTSETKSEAKESGAAPRPDTKKPDAA